MAAFPASLTINTKLDMISLGDLRGNVVQIIFGRKVQFNKSDPIRSVIFSSMVFGRMTHYDFNGCYSPIVFVEDRNVRTTLGK